MEIISNQLIEANSSLAGFSEAKFLKHCVAEMYKIQFSAGAAFVGPSSCWAAAMIVPTPDFRDRIYLATSQLYRMTASISGADTALANPQPGGHAERAVVNGIIYNKLNFDAVGSPPGGVLYVELSPCLDKCLPWLNSLDLVGGINCLYVWYSHEHSTSDPDVNTTNLNALHLSYLT